MSEDFGDEHPDLRKLRREMRHATRETRVASARIAEIIWITAGDLRLLRGLGERVVAALGAVDERPVRRLAQELVVTLDASDFSNLSDDEEEFVVFMARIPAKKKELSPWVRRAVRAYAHEDIVEMAEDAIDLLDELFAALHEGALPVLERVAPDLASEVRKAGAAIGQVGRRAAP